MAIGVFGTVENPVTRAASEVATTIFSITKHTYQFNSISVQLATVER